MKLQGRMKIVDTAVTEGSRGSYLKVIAVQSGEVIEGYSKDLDLVKDVDLSKEVSVGLQFKKYNGKYQSPEFLAVTK